MHDLSVAWLMSHQVNKLLLDAIEEKHLGDRYALRTRPVAAQFAHMHNVRVRWLTHSAPELAAEVAQYPRGAELKKEDLMDALESSAAVVASYLDTCDEAGNVPNWNGPPASFLAYLVSHEAHHRGQIMAALIACGHRPPDEKVDALWQW